MVTFTALPKPDKSTFRIVIREMESGSVAQPGIVWKRVQQIFDQFCTSSGSLFSSSSAYWANNPVKATDIEAHELICYLIAGQPKDDGPASSLIRKHFSGYWAAHKPVSTTVGMTVVGIGKNLSEVYVGHPFLEGQPMRIANTIIHELMHNKLNMDDSLHNAAPGFAGAGGGFSQAIIPTQTMVMRLAGVNVEATPWDISTMGPALGKSVMQRSEL